MNYQDNKIYRLERKDFTVSKEAGRTLFLVNDSPTEYPIRIAPFKFQEVNIPDVLVCKYYKGKFHQVKRELVPLLYEDGSVHEFTILSQTRGQNSVCNVIDDASGVYFSRVPIAGRKFNKSERANLRVRYPDADSDADIILEFIEEPKSVRKVGFSVSKFKKLPSVAKFTKMRWWKTFESDTLWTTAQERESAGNKYWLLDLLSQVMDAARSWTRGRRSNLMKAFYDAVIEVIEGSDYLHEFQGDEFAAAQSSIESTAHRAEIYIKALGLIAKDEQNAFVAKVFSQLKNNHPIYRADIQFGLLGILFSLGTELSVDAMQEIFGLIRKRHADPHFVKDYAPGIIAFLEALIDKESSRFFPFNRERLSLIIEATALELLMTQGINFPMWSRHRGMMYLNAAMLGICPNEQLLKKAYYALTSQMASPLEYSWNDTSDVNMLTSTKLANPTNDVSPKNSIFENKEMSLRLRGNFMTLYKSMGEGNAKKVVSLVPAGDIEACVMLDDRLSQKLNADAQTIGRRPELWAEIEAGLTSDVVVRRTTKKKPESQMLAVGDMVYFRVKSQSDYDKYLFECEVAGFPEVKASIRMKDIARLLIKRPVVDMFMKDGEPMVFQGKVISAASQASVELSLTEKTLQYYLRRAQEDYDQESALQAIVTGRVPGNGNTYFILTESYYPALFHNVDNLDVDCNSVINVRVDNIKPRLDEDKLYVNCFEADGEVAEWSPEEVQGYVQEAFVDLLLNISEEDASGFAWSEPDEFDPDAEVSGDVDFLYEEEVQPLARFFETAAFLKRKELGTSYDYLAYARLLAVLSHGDADVISLKLSALELMDTFALAGRVDVTSLKELEQRTSKMKGARNDRDLVQMLQTLNMLSYMESDKPLKDSLTEDCGPELDRLRSLVEAYNIVSRYGVRGVRRELRSEIFQLVGLRPSQQYAETLDNDEDQLHEYKTSLIYPAGNKMRADEKAQGREIAEIIDGMLNADGGTLYLGVNDMKVPIGLNEDFIYLSHGSDKYDTRKIRDVFELKLMDCIRRNIGLLYDGHSLNQFIGYKWESRSGRDMLQITVTPFPGVVPMIDGKIFIRDKSSTVPLKGKGEIEKYAAKRQQRFKA